jgi:hypothetical protein
MAPQSGIYFDGRPTDTHDAIQAQVYNVTWLGEIHPVAEGPTKRIAGVLMWLFHSLGLCCATVGESAMYIVGNLRFRHDFLTIIIAHHSQNLSPEIRILLQIQNTSVFSLGSMDYLLQPLFFKPGENIIYIVRYGEETLPVSLECVDSLEPCGPRSNLDFVHFI